MDSLASQWMRQYFEPKDYYIGVQEYGMLLLDFLRSPEGHRIKDTVKYLVVDEFQDLSKSQLDMVMEFYRGSSYILAIGDVAQNIYEWRGCHGHFLSSLSQRIPEMIEYRLTENRRCTPEIIDVGNACLRGVTHAANNRLMRPIRASLGIKPVLDTLSSKKRSMGSHVLRVIRHYATTFGYTYSDIAVIGRYKQPLFAVEETLTKYNRLEIDVVPFVASISVGEMEKNLRRKDGHTTLMTLHQAKGLEWKVVILILWDPGTINEEEVRLLYVGNTRARDRLHIISPNSKITHAFLERFRNIAELFDGPGGEPLLRETPKEDYRQPTDTKKRKTGVVELIRSLSCEQIQEMRKRELIPKTRGIVRASPGCRIRMYNPINDEFVERKDDEVPVLKVDDEVDGNGFQLEFGNFVDRYITRALWLRINKEDSPIEDIDTLYILKTVFLNHEEGLSCRKHGDALASLVANESSIDVLQDMVGASMEHMKSIYDVYHRMKSRSRDTGIDISELILKEGRPVMNQREICRLRDSYTNFQDRNLTAQKTVFYVFRVSLASVIMKGRKSLWYHPSAFNWFREKLNTKLLPCIRRFIDHVYANSAELHLKKMFEYDGISGEADLVTHNEVIDFKCSRRIHDFAWLGQVLAYMAMASALPEHPGLTRLSIFNPIVQTIWEYDCSTWNGRTAYIDHLAYIAADVVKDRLKETNNELTTN